MHSIKASDFYEFIEGTNRMRFKNPDFTYLDDPNVQYDKVDDSANDKINQFIEHAEQTVKELIDKQIKLGQIETVKTDLGVERKVIKMSPEFAETIEKLNTELDNIFLESNYPPSFIAKMVDIVPRITLSTTHRTTHL